MKLHTPIKWMASALFLGAMAFGQAYAAEEHDLQKAFLKEYTFLLKEKKALEQRLAQVKKDTQEEKLGIERDINRLKERVNQAETEAGRLNDHILTVEKETIAKETNQNVYEATLDQANATLNPEGDKRLSSIEGIVSASLSMLDLNSQVRSEPGVFYLQDGKEVKGEVVHFGGIARYGISEQGTGPLAPAGGGVFKLWQESDKPEQIQALTQGQIPETMDIFLFESPTKEVKTVEDKDVLTIINSGGVIAWVIVILGLVAVLFAILRATFLSNLGRKSQAQFNAIAEAVAAHNLDKAKEIAANTQGSIKRVVNTALRNITREREHVEDAISEAILHENAALDRFQSTIMVIAAISPLLGLLGTVTGMIETFDIITEFGTGDPKLLSGGISIALVTTELGLIVAIPVLLIGTLLASWANKIKDDLEKSALHIINQYQNAINR